MSVSTKDTVMLEMGLLKDAVSQSFADRAVKRALSGVIAEEDGRARKGEAREEEEEPSDATSDAEEGRKEGGAPERRSTRKRASDSDADARRWPRRPPKETQAPFPAAGLAPTPAGAPARKAAAAAGVPARVRKSVGKISAGVSEAAGQLAGPKIGWAVLICGVGGFFVVLVLAILLFFTYTRLQESRKHEEYVTNKLTEEYKGRLEEVKSKQATSEGEIQSLTERLGKAASQEEKAKLEAQLAAAKEKEQTQSQDIADYHTKLQNAAAAVEDAKGDALAGQEAMAKVKKFMGKPCNDEHSMHQCGDVLVCVNSHCKAMPCSKDDECGDGKVQRCRSIDGGASYCEAELCSWIAEKQAAQKTEGLDLAQQAEASMKIANELSIELKLQAAARNEPDTFYHHGDFNFAADSCDAHVLTTLASWHLQYQEDKSQQYLAVCLERRDSGIGSC